jgi:general secretion pathway protein I
MGSTARRILRRRGAAGFTLLEVLVALAVLGLTMAAVIKAAGEYTLNQAYLRDRTFATWVANNVLVEQQLKGGWPSIGRRKGVSEMGSREWEWTVNISQTADEDLRRLDVEVNAAGEEGGPLAVLSGFITRPPS